MGSYESLWKKYLEGRATLEELKELKAWLQSSSPDDEEWMTLVREDTRKGLPMPSDRAMRMRERMQELAVQEKEPAAGGSVQRRVFWRSIARRRMAAAASVILVLCGVAYFISRRSQEPGTVQSEVRWDSITNNAAGARLVTLSDQTKVWLNRGAVLYVSRNYAVERRVLLKGEGYFDVARDEQHPFTVWADNLQTTVLGTAFNIDNNPVQSAIHISLVKGSIKVQHTGDTAAVILSPGQMVRADRRSGDIPVSRIGVPDIASWVNGDLVLDQLPLSEALQKLEVCYGITIRADASLLAGKTVTAVYHKKESWQQVLRHLLFIYQLSYKVQRGDSITIIQP
ncbi:MAG: FecR domain-containing protein [Chitinophagaceae bacterium]|nr:FecR domain-containing protein [Chitinophagaceae bacterium]